MALIWTKQLSVGNETFDSDHKRIIGVINEIEYAVQTRDYSVLLRELKLLMHHLHVHEAKEEQFSQMASLSFDQHRLAHQHLQKELQRTGDELEAKNGVWPEYVMDHYPQLLREWLVEHITKEDMQMKPALETYPYDFQPG